MPSVVVAGASGYAGALAARLAVPPPALRARRGHRAARTPGARLDDLYPRHRVPLSSRSSTSTATATSTRRSSPTRTAPRRRSSPRCASAACASSTCRADFRLRDRRRLRATGTSRTRTPSCSSEAVYGLPELRRDAIDGAEPRRQPRLLPDRGAARARAARAAACDDVVIDAKTGVSGAGRAPTETTHFVSVDENVDALRRRPATATRPRSTRSSRRSARR